MTAAQWARRLIGREYLPFAGWLLGWALLAAAIGHADAARLFAAYLFLRAARAFALMDTLPAIRRRWNAPPAIRAKGRRRAAAIEAISIGAEAMLVIGIAWALFGIGQDRAAEMTIILLTGIPARHLLFLSRSPAALHDYKIAVSWAGALLAALVLAAGGDWTAAAGIIALREWIALLIGMIPRGTIRLRASSDAPLDWREVAAITGTRARHRLSYRVGKGLLGAVLGPFSGFVARTGRGIGLHRRMDRIVPKSPLPVALLALGSTAAAILLQVALAKPATLVASASLLRIAGVAGSVLLWLRHAREIDPNEDDDDDED